MREIWKPVPSHPGWEASSLGRVRILPYVAGKARFYSVGPTYGTLKQQGAYSCFEIFRRRENRYFKVHRLVCEAFHGSAPEGRKYALHRDENSRNNKPDNLYWGTQKENVYAPKYRSYNLARKRGLDGRWV